MEGPCEAQATLEALEGTYYGVDSSANSR
jgi:hypothetical protein